jgi:hypothetical protein
MDETLPINQAIAEIESRQDEVLRKLDALEQQLLRTLAEFGDKSKLNERCGKLEGSETEVTALPMAACGEVCKARGRGKCARKAA